MKNILITGATGTLGQGIIDELLTAKQSVRVLIRTREKADFSSKIELFEGDLAKPETLTDAFQSVDQMVLLADPSTIKGALEAAKEAGVEYIVLVSSAAVTAGYDTTWNLVAEQELQKSGIAWSIVRPGEFMKNALQIWGPSIRREQRAVEPYPDQISSAIDDRDVVDVIVADLLDATNRRGRIDTIVGPDTLTKRQQIQIIGQAIGKEIAIDVVTSAEAREFYKKQGGFAADNADFLFGFESYDGVEGEYDEPHDTAVNQEDSAFVTIDKVIGKPARTFAEWAHDHAEDFTSSS